jgi:hypothetical protein
MNALPMTIRQQAVSESRQLLEELLGRLYLVDPAAPIRELDAVLNPLWAQANKALAAVFGGQTLRFHMFRQPSYMSAVKHIVGTLSGDDERTRYTYMISLFREDIDLAIERLEGHIPFTRASR